MLAWLLNLGFAGGEVPLRAVTRPVARIICVLAAEDRINVLVEEDRDVDSIVQGRTVVFDAEVC